MYEFLIKIKISNMENTFKFLEILAFLKCTDKNDRMILNNN